MHEPHIQRMIERHLLEDYKTPMHWQSVRTSPYSGDKSHRFNVTDRDGVEMIITARVVGGTRGNSKQYREWPFASGADLRRMALERPNGFFGAFLVVGMLPNDEGIWWSALYDESILAKMRWYPVMDGRMHRIPADMARPALIHRSDLLQMDLGFGADKRCGHVSVVRLEDRWECVECAEAFAPVGVLA